MQWNELAQWVAIVFVFLLFLSIREDIRSLVRVQRGVIEQQERQARWIRTFREGLLRRMRERN